MLPVPLHTELTVATAALGGKCEGHLIRAWSFNLLGDPSCLLPDGKEQLGAPEEGEISQSNLSLIPGLGLRLEMAAAEPGSLGTPARRPRLLLATPVLSRDSDPGGLAQPAKGWGLRAPSTPSPAQLQEMVLTQVSSLVGGKKEAHSWGVDGRKPVLQSLSGSLCSPSGFSDGGPPSSLHCRELFVDGRREEG